VIDPEVIMAAVVTKLQSVTELVDELDGDVDAIRAFVDRYPSQTSLDQEIETAPVPSIILGYQGTVPGIVNRREAWRHAFVINLRVANPMKCFAIIANSTLFVEFSPDVFRMETPTCQRQRLLISEQPLRFLDYFQISISITEKGT
jgi:hypothetical protein